MSNTSNYSYEDQQLFYLNLEDNIEENTAKAIRFNTKNALGIIGEYLSRAKRVKESETCALEWILSNKKSTNGVWIQLKRTKGMSYNIESKYVREFLRSRRIYNKGLDYESSIKIITSNHDTNELLIEKEPEYRTIYIKPNIVDLQRQRTAMFALRDTPHPKHKPLLKLFENKRKTIWPTNNVKRVKEWFILKPNPDIGKFSNNTIDQQRRFTEIALSSEDFTILEGPPGTGKTTSICEYILQVIKNDGRVLLCASTHVAVDNVLEQLTKYDEVIAVRIGTDQEKISPNVIDYHISVYKEKEKNRLITFLESITNPAESQQYLLNSLKTDNDETITNIILDSANLICGTTSGIMEHPVIKNELVNPEPIYDVLIIDEASKTTFQDFLVPALYAKKWVIVGDPLQLSPFADSKDIASNIKGILSEADGHICLDVFSCWKNKGTLLVIDDNVTTLEKYKKQAWSFRLPYYHITDQPCDQMILSASIILVNHKNLLKNIDSVPMDVTDIRGNYIDKSLQRRNNYWKTIHKKNLSLIRILKQDSWEEVIARRLDRVYQLRNSTVGSAEYNKMQAYLEELDMLQPQWTFEGADNLVNIIETTKNIALPSIIESIKEGVKNNKTINPSVLSTGFDKKDLESRFVKLEYQYRMHPEISKFSRNNFYKNSSLKEDAFYMEKIRKWDYNRYAYRAGWINVTGHKDKSLFSNENEAKTIIEELRNFIEWAEPENKKPVNPPIDENYWEVAILTFYLDQESKLRAKLLNSNLFGRNTLNDFWSKKENVHVYLCTVDRFQGHEADLVFLSFVQTTDIGFLDSPNRLNVALTRARYQMVLVGNHTFFVNQNQSDLLMALAIDLPMDIKFKKG